MSAVAGRLVQTSEKLEALRDLMRAQQVAAWIIPSSDPHGSEYVAAHWQARAWLSGFRGSAGTLLVTLDSAGLWTDPRYHIRAAQELAGSGIELFKAGLPGTLSMEEWLGQVLPGGVVVGFHAAALSMSEADTLASLLLKWDIRLVAGEDLVGQIWAERPAIPSNPIYLYADVFAGESRAQKLLRIRAGMRAVGAQYHLLCALDDIAWTLNIRGSDIDYNPLAVCYALVAETGVELFIESLKVPGPVRETLELDGVSLRPYTQVEQALAELPDGCGILVHPEKTNARLSRLIPGKCRVIKGASLPYQMKTIKNPVELDGLREMHKRDGVALVRWLYWLASNLAQGGCTEITAAEKLREFRAQGQHFRGLSFATIAGYASNSAVGHYQSDPLSAPSLRPEGIFLIDSGGQYLDGTSDITRTVTLGDPTLEQKRVFTTVLQSHIRLASAHFPRGTRGQQLDAVARDLFWRQGWNCRHGIGHGVGHFLNVHENPPRFNEVNNTLLEAGMLLSNEPGVYFEGRFGVRIENLVVVVPDGSSEFGEFLAFETVSLCPIDLELVDSGMLSLEERNWLNAYHQRVWDELSPLLDGSERAWLRRETRVV